MFEFISPLPSQGNDRLALKENPGSLPSPVIPR